MKRISSFAVLMVFAVLTVIGVGLLTRLSVQFLPSLQSPSISIQYNWYDTAPEVLEQEVTTLLEGAFSLIKGVRKIYSVSGNGNGNIRLDFDKNAPTDYLRFEIASKIRQLYPRLPQGVSYPVLQVNQSQEEEKERPLLIYSLTGNENPAKLYRYALEQLNPKLSLTPGIRIIEVAGGNDLEWLITYDVWLMETLQLHVEDLQKAIRQYFQVDALGVTKQDGYYFSVQLNNRFAKGVPNTTEWNNIPIQNINGRIIRLADVAKIQLSERPPQQHYRVNGQNSVRLIFYPEQQVNTIQLAKVIKKRMNELIKFMPNTYKFYLEDDSTEYLQEELNKIQYRTLFSLCILLGFTLLVYRSFRYVLVVLLSLVANLGLAFIFYYLLKVEIHLYALAGITVSFGIAIDNTIVMAHHIRTQGNAKIFPALLAATLTTISALIVIFFLPDFWKINLLDFAKVIMINLGISLLIAILLVPALLEKIVLKGKKKFNSIVYLKRLKKLNRRYETCLIFLCNYRSILIIFIILLFGLPVFLLPNKIENWNWYNRVLGSDWYIDNAKPIVNKLLGGTLRLFVQYVYEGSAYREPDETILYIQGSMPAGATLEQMNAVFRQVENYLSQFNIEIKRYTTNIPNGQSGVTQVQFNSGYDLTFPYLLKSRMIAYSINLGGVKWNIYGVGRGFNNDSSGMPPRFRIQMYGYDKNELERQANQFANKLLIHPRIQEVNTNANINWWGKDLYQYEMTLQPKALAQFKISHQDIKNSLTSFNQAPAYTLEMPGNIAVRLMDTNLDENNLWFLQNKALRTDSATFLFQDIGVMEKKKVSNSLHKEDQQYIRIIEFEYTGSVQFGKRHLEKCIEEMKKEMPLGYAIKEITSRFDQDSQHLYRLILLVIILIFMICAIHFESLLQSLTIIILIPLSFIGIFLTFYWFDIYFDQGGYTSFIVMSGLVVNSLIFILNDHNSFRKRHPYTSDIKLFIKALNHKILPILLTIASTVLGLMPFLVVGNQDIFWFALAAGVIGGITFSLFVITIFSPVLICKK